MQEGLPNQTSAFQFPSGSAPAPGAVAGASPTTQRIRRGFHFLQHVAGAVGILTHSSCSVLPAGRQQHVAQRAAGILPADRLQEGLPNQTSAFQFPSGSAPAPGAVAGASPTTHRKGERGSIFATRCWCCGNFNPQFVFGSAGGTPAARCASVLPASCRQIDCRKGCRTKPAHFNSPRGARPPRAPWLAPRQPLIE